MGYGKISVAQGYKPSSRTVAARRRWRLGDSFVISFLLTDEIFKPVFLC